MPKKEIQYFTLDEQKNPIACSKLAWEKIKKRKFNLLVDKCGYSKVKTSFISKHIVGDVKNNFKTSVYGSLNLLIYVCYYCDYNSAILGHKKVLEEKPWIAIMESKCKLIA